MSNQERRFHDRQRGGRGGGGPGGEASELTEQETREVLSGNQRMIDECAHKLARQLSAVEPTQIRNFYGPLARLRAKADPKERMRELLKHRPRIAYMVARSTRRHEAEALWKVFGNLIKQASTPDDVEAICSLAEAVVAYHRYERR